MINISSRVRDTDATLDRSPNEKKGNQSEYYNFNHSVRRMKWSWLDSFQPSFPPEKEARPVARMVPFPIAVDPFQKNRRTP